MWGGLSSHRERVTLAVHTDTSPVQQGQGPPLGNLLAQSQAGSAYRVNSVYAEPASRLAAPATTETTPAMSAARAALLLAFVAATAAADYQPGDAVPGAEGGGGGAPDLGVLQPPPLPLPPPSAACRHSAPHPCPIS